MAIVLAVMLILSACPIAFAVDDDIASGTAGEGIDWVIDAAGTLTISGEGEIVVDWYAPPWEDYNDSILNVVVKEGITKIPSSAFCYAENLETVSVPASVIDMDDGTTIFWDCESLREINVDTDNKNYVSVDGVVFTEDMTTLCFYPANKSGETYTIPDSVTTVKNNAFQSNQTLKSVIIPDTVTTLEIDVFYASNIKSITIGSGIKTIPSSCFSDCNIESIVIPDSVEVIGGSAFYGCNALKTVTIGSGVKSIGRDVFNYCNSLTAIHYTGTEETWAEIEINELNEFLNTLPVHYITEDDYKEGFAVADCTTNGHTGGLYCETCATFVTGSAISAPGHDFADGVCQADGCGYVCEHRHEDIDGICDICGKDVGFPTIKVGETKTASFNNSVFENYVEFAPTESSEYIITADSDNNIYTYVTILDSEGGAINGDSGNGFELSFEAEAGETYYFVLGYFSYEDNEETTYTYTLDKHIYFAHQPTMSEPYAELNDDSGATYQWYNVEYNGEEITDQDADAVSYDWGTTSYDAETGWTGVMDAWYSEDCFDYFTVPLEAGNTIMIEVTGDNIEGVGIYDYDIDSGVWQDTVSDIYIFTVERDGNYTPYVYADNADVTMRAYIGEAVYTKIDGQTQSTLTDAVVGERYACKATVGEKVFTSDIFEYTYVITHQPTAIEPYVRLNETDGAKYQWYKTGNGDFVEITDEIGMNITPSDPEEDSTEKSSYDSETGWSPYYYGESSYAYFFAIDLEEGDIVKTVLNGEAEVVLMVNYSDEEAEYDFPDSDGTVTLTAPETGTYVIMAASGSAITAKAYISRNEYTAVEGETAARLANPEAYENYACEITVGGKVLTSDTFEYFYTITHQPTENEPYVEVNDDTDVAYQWYAAKGTGYGEITDVNAEPVDNYGTGASSYDSESGWLGNYWSNGDGADFFEIYLEAGETIDIVINGNATNVAIIDYDYLIMDSDVPDSDGVVTLTAPESTTYTVAAYCDAGTTVKAYANKREYVALEGETAAYLANPDVNTTYICEVTYADGSIEMSDNVAIGYMWYINVDKTGVYTLSPNANYTGEFSIDGISVFDKQGNEVKYHEKSGGFPLVAGQKYTVKFNHDCSDEINGAITWKLTKKADTIFADSKANEWYNDAITYSVGRGLVSGYGGTNNFGPADYIQRQDFVVILSRLAGVDLSEYDDVENPFNDVPDGEYYTNAILWAKEAGITTGYAGGTEFGVGDVITREQLVTFLYRYAKYVNDGAALDLSENAEDNAAAYADFARVTDYAQDPIIWALDNGVIKGQGGTHIAPAGNALRCEVAQIMYNIFLNDIF